MKYLLQTNPHHKKKNLTSTSHYNKPIIGLFAFVMLETAFHKFRAFLLITFNYIAQFFSNFFQTVRNHKAHLPKMFLSIKIIAVVYHKQENSYLENVGSEN